MHTIPTELLKEIAAYLQQRPFRDVVGLLMQIEQQCKPVEHPKE